MLNEAELLLLDRWPEATLLEQTLEGVRGKYALLLGRVLDAIQKNHPELNAHQQFVDKLDGWIGVGRETWSQRDATNPPGLVLDHIRLERLTAGDSTPPQLYVWIHRNTAKVVGKPVAELVATLCARAKDVFGEKFNDVVHHRTDAALYFRAPSKKEILDLLIAGNEDVFVDQLAAYFDAPSQLVPVLDQVLIQR